MSATVDGNGNKITVADSGRCIDGHPILIVRLVDEPEHGYLVEDEGTGGFGDEDCPSSYGMPCMPWFGAGERYPTPEAARAAWEDGPESTVETCVRCGLGFDFRSGAQLCWRCRKL